jgi:hypothetical protein
MNKIYQCLDEENSVIMVVKDRGEVHKFEDAKRRCKNKTKKRTCFSSHFYVCFYLKYQPED